MKEEANIEHEITGEQARDIISLISFAADGNLDALKTIIEKDK